MHYGLIAIICWATAVTIASPIVPPQRQSEPQPKQPQYFQPTYWDAGLPAALTAGAILLRFLVLPRTRGSNSRGESAPDTRTPDQKKAYNACVDLLCWTATGYKRSLKPWEDDLCKRYMLGEIDSTQVLKAHAAGEGGGEEKGESTDQGEDQSNSFQVPAGDVVNAIGNGLTSAASVAVPFTLNSLNGMTAGQEGDSPV